jgi:hypothetical protein
MTDIPTILLTTTDTGSLAAALDFLQKGGIFMIPLAITSVVGTMAILYKALSLSGSRVIPGALARDVSQFQQRIVADKVEPVIAEFEKGRSTLARLAAIRFHRFRAQINQPIDCPQQRRAALPKGFKIVHLAQLIERQSRYFRLNFGDCLFQQLL